MYNSNGGFAPKIRLVLGQSWIVIPMYKHTHIMCKCISHFNVLYLHTIASRIIFLCNFVRERGAVAASSEVVEKIILLDKSQE